VGQVSRASSAIKIYLCHIYAGLVSSALCSAHATTGRKTLTYSNEYQSDMQNLEIKIDSLEASNRDLLSRVEHNAHIRKTQNLMLRKMRNTNMISNEEYDSAMHSTDH